MFIMDTLKWCTLNLYQVFQWLYNVEALEVRAYTFFFSEYHYFQTLIFHCKARIAFVPKLEFFLQAIVSVIKVHYRLV